MPEQVAGVDRVRSLVSGYARECLGDLTQAAETPRPDQAAQELGWPKSSLASRLARGRDLLRQRLVKRGITLSAGAVTTALMENAAQASVATLLTINTVKAAASIAAGKTVAEGVPSDQALALAEEAMKTMIGIKARRVLLLLTLALTVGVGFAGSSAWLGPPKVDQKRLPAVQGEPPKKDAPGPALDRHGDPLPAGAVARLGTVRWRHAGLTTFAAFLSDGKTVLSAGADQTIRIWEYPSGKELRRISSPVDERRSSDSGRGFAFPVAFPVALSPDGKTVAASFKSNEVGIFDAGTGKELQTLTLTPPIVGNRGVVPVRNLVFSPDGQQVAVLGYVPKRGLGLSISIWDWAKAKELRTIALQLGAAPVPDDTLVWSPDGTALATIHSHRGGPWRGRRTASIRLWDPATGKELRTLALPEDAPYHGLVFSPDSKMLAVARSMGPIVVVDVGTGAVRTWKHGMEPYAYPALVFGRDSTKLYGCTTHEKHICKNEQKREWLRSEYCKRVVEWDAKTGKELRKRDLEVGPCNTGGSYGLPIPSAGWSPDGKLLALNANCHDNNALEFVDVAALKWIDTGSAWAFPLRAIHFTPDGKHLFSPGDGRIYKWDAVTGKQLGSPATPLVSEGRPTAWGLTSPEGQALWARMHAWGLWDDKTNTGKNIGPLGVMPNAPTLFVLFSPDGKMLAQTGGADKLTLHEVPTGKLLHTIATMAVDVREMVRGGTDPRSHILFFAPDSRLLAAFADANTLGVWDTASGQRTASLIPAEPTAIHSGAFSPDGRCVALNQNDDTVALYELASGHVRRTFGTRAAGKKVSKPGGREAWIWRNPLERRVVFGKEGRTLLHAGLDNVVHVWDVASGKELAAFAGHRGAINSLALAPDGKTLASASADTTALLWDLTSVSRPAPAGKGLTKAGCEACWEALLSDDAAKAFAALCDLCAAPKDAVALIKERVKPAAPLDSKRVAASIAALDSDVFQTRQQASAELFKMGEQVIPALDKALAAKPPLDTKRRLEELRGRMTGMTLEGDRLRAYRALEALELIGTPEARQVLQELAEGVPGALLTTTARATLQRLTQKKKQAMQRDLTFPRLRDKVQGSRSMTNCNESGWGLGCITTFREDPTGESHPKSAPKGCPPTTHPFGGSRC
jgi:WD40 repeat protein